MSIRLAVVVLAISVLLGGLAALVRDTGRRGMPALRMFAVVAAACIAVLHLLPEAIHEVGFGALLVAAAGALGPSLLERLAPTAHDHGADAPTTALAIGYGAVIVHQAGEGAALASIARGGTLSSSLVFAVAGHTVPLAMVVAIRILELKGGSPAKAGRAAALAMAGLALATALGATLGSFVEGTRLAAMQPWLLAVVAGLLLHALAHGSLGPAPGADLLGRLLSAAAGLAGLALAVAGAEEGEWRQRVPQFVQLGGIAALAALLLLFCLVPRAPRPLEHAHDGDHDHEPPLGGA